MEDQHQSDNAVSDRAQRRLAKTLSHLSVGEDQTGSRQVSGQDCKVHFTTLCFILLCLPAVASPGAWERTVPLVGLMHNTLAYPQSLCVSRPTL
jgi:hypothetical protein